MENLNYWKNRYENLKSTGTVGNMKWNNDYNDEQKKVFQKIEEILSSNVDKNKIVIDFGCGLCNYLNSIKKITEYKKCYCYDVIEIPLEESKKRYGDDNTNFILYKDDTEINKFDYGFIFFTLQHVMSDEEFINILIKIKSSMNSKGKLFIFDNISDNKDLPYMRFRNYDEHEYLFIKSGFNCKKIDVINITGQDVCLFELTKKVQNESKRNINRI